LGLQTKGGGNGQHPIERRRLEDELKKTLLKACDDSDKAGYSTKSFRNSMAKDGPMDAVSRVIKSEKTSGFAAVAELKRLDLTGEALRSAAVGSLRPHGAGPGAEATDSTSHAPGQAIRIAPIAK
jgi:hypothetical protein